tara:strand:+ start:32 stop:385 length:354 start_codon:yes stop_codon:yes gene_type:complete
MITINIIGLLLIGLIVWWFWLSSAKALRINDETIRVEVKDGVYSPAKIEVSANKPITIEFIRTDSASCSEIIVFESLGIHEKLPLNQAYPIKLGVLAPGTYSFTCQMNMYAGELIVR